jgi:hypothetical protein
MSAIFLKSNQIEQAVREMYRKNGCIVLSQVRNGTGFERRARTADMLVVSTWPSRGLYCEGIEIKSSRSDLMRELEKPQKADEIARYCRYWHVAVPEGLTEGVRVPPLWGIISVNEKLKAKELRPAKVLEPQPMDALLVCSILRNFAENFVPLAEVQPKIAEAAEEARKSAKSSSDYRRVELEGILTNFKSTSGIDLLERSWNAGQIGAAVKLIMNLRGKPVEEIARAQDALRTGLAAIDAALKFMDTPL